jgi:hypothetical protein
VAVIERRRRLRRMVIGVMAGAVAFLAVAVVCGANRAAQIQEQAASYSPPPVATVTPLTAEAIAAPSDLQDTHGGGPPTSPNAARFHRSKSVPIPSHKARNASVMPR